MLRALHGLSNPKHKEAYVLFVKGYFGDGDEYFYEEISSVYKYLYDKIGNRIEKGENYIEEAFKAYSYFKDNWCETRSELPEKYQPYIQGASWDSELLLNRVEELSLVYFNHLGQPNDVEVS